MQIKKIVLGAIVAIISANSCLYASAEPVSVLCMDRKSGRLLVRIKCKKSESAVTSKSLTNAVSANVVGQKGDKGDVGVQGLQGVKGDQGLQGIKGDQGIQGVKGDQGIQGPSGLKGDRGDPGQDAPLNFTLYDSTEQPIGPVLQLGCPQGGSVMFDTITTVIQISGSSYLICAEKAGFAGFTDILYSTNDCTGTPYHPVVGLPSYGNTLLVPALLENNPNQAKLYSIDYISSPVSVTYNSYRAATNGQCQITTSGPYPMRPLIYIGNLSSLYTPPFNVK
jgi:hypothetical protein